MRRCNKCWMPNEQRLVCTNCDRTDIIEIKANYSMTQWEHWYNMTKTASHDFYPHEFNEDGTINRSSGITGNTGYRPDETPNYKKVFGKGWMKK